MAVLDTLDIAKYVTACANKARITVKFVKGVTPAASATTITIPTPSSTMSREEEVALKRFVSHETSHITYSDFMVLERYKPVGLLMFITNLLEDHRVDYLNDKEFHGDRLITNEYMDSYAKQTTSIDGDVTAPLFAWDSIIRMDLWHNTATDLFLSQMSEKGKDVFVKLCKADYSDVLRNVRTVVSGGEGSELCYFLAKRILEEVFEQDASGYEKADCEDGKGDEAKEKGDEAKEKGGKGDDTLRYVDFKGAKVLPSTMHIDNGGINASNYTVGKGGYTPTADKDILLCDYTTGVQKGKTFISTSPDGAKDILSLLTSEESLASKLRTRLQVQSRDRWEYGKCAGKLRSSSLHRVASKVDDRVFKKQIRNTTLDVAVQLLVDASGSMSGAKFKHAAAAACLLNKTLGTVLHVPIEILAFTELFDSKTSTDHTMFVLKNFNKPQSTESLARWFGAIGAHYLADNVDGESLAWAYNRIKMRKEKRKIMLVLSDGSPCGGHAKGDVFQHTRDVIHAIERSSVELLGIGVMHDTSAWYKKHVTIDSASTIESALLEIVSKHVFR